MTIIEQWLSVPKQSTKIIRTKNEELLNKYKTGDINKTEFFELMLKNNRQLLSVWIKYFSLPLDDVAVYATLALDIALDKYDPDRGDFIVHWAYRLRGIVRKERYYGELEESQIHIPISCKDKEHIELSMDDDDNNVHNQLGCIHPDTLGILIASRITSDTEADIIYNYITLGTMKEVADKLKLSITTCWKHISNWKNKMKDLTPLFPI